MNTDEFYAQLRAELAKRLQSDSRLTTIAEKIKQKEADFKDTAEYSQIVARHISELIQQKVGTNSAVGIEFVCKELLKDHYSAINDVLGTVQAIVDEKQNIHIAPQKAPLPQERVNKVAYALMDPRVPIEVIKRRAGAPVENVANSFHDDYIKENAKFRNDAGLKCYINRTTDGNCCDWCTKMAGRYVYGEHPDDVFRRHDNCGCKTIYESGRTRQDVWTKKSWEAPDVVKDAPKPTKLSFEQGKALEKKNLRKYHGLTADSKGGIIKAITIDDIKTADKKGVLSEDCIETICNTIAEYRKSGHKFRFDSVQIVSIPMKDGKLDVLRTNAIDRYGHPQVVLEINQVVFGGYTKKDIDAIFFGSNYTVCESFQDAVIHEIGHAKVIYGRTYANYERIAEELSTIHNRSISTLASKDGLELIAECEVLLSRGELLPEDILEDYKTYTTGGG